MLINFRLVDCIEQIRNGKIPDISKEESLSAEQYKILFEAAQYHNIPPQEEARLMEWSSTIGVSLVDRFESEKELNQEMRAIDPAWIKESMDDLELSLELVADDLGMSPDEFKMLMRLWEIAPKNVNNITVVAFHWYFTSKRREREQDLLSDYLSSITG